MCFEGWEAMSFDEQPSLEKKKLWDYCFSFLTPPPQWNTTGISLSPVLGYLDSWQLCPVQMCHSLATLLILGFLFSFFLWRPNHLPLTIPEQQNFNWLQLYMVFIVYMGYKSHLVQTVILYLDLGLIVLSNHSFLTCRFGSTCTLWIW